MKRFQWSAKNVTAVIVFAIVASVYRPMQSQPKSPSSSELGGVNHDNHRESGCRTGSIFAAAAILPERRRRLPKGIRLYRYNNFSPMYDYGGHPFADYKPSPRWHEGVDPFPYTRLLGLTTARRIAPIHVWITRFALRTHTSDPWAYNYRFP